MVVAVVEFGGGEWEYIVFVCFGIGVGGLFLEFSKKRKNL